MFSTLILLSTLALAEEPVAVPTADVPEVSETLAVSETPVTTPDVAPAPEPEVAPAPTPAPEVAIPTTEAEVVQDVQDGITAIQAGKWGTAIILFLGVLAFIYNKFLRAKTVV